MSKFPYLVLEIHKRDYSLETDLKNNSDQQILRWKLMKIQRRYEK